jgi:charged multivesicular body protein 6
MLGGRISNQDEDEVEDELVALEAELTAVPLPEVPTRKLQSEERAESTQRGLEEQREESRVAVLAS